MKFVLLKYIFAFTLVTALFVGYWNHVGEKEKEMKSHLGQSVVINGDSLVVVNYDFFDNTYMLNNGIEISPEMITK